MILKSGERIEGKIKNQNRTQLELQKLDGTKIIIDKDKIQRILFGPTQKEIEEQRRREEELRKKKEKEQRRREEELRKKKEKEQRRMEEELRKKKEEEQRRNEEELRKKKEEEEKRIEDERRKKQEEQKRIQIKIRPLEKRHGLEIGYGTGPANIVPSFFKIYDLFFNGILIFSQNFLIFSYNYESFNQQLFIKYFKNDIEVGFSLSLFQLDSSNFKNKLRFGSGYQRFQYQNLIYTFNNDVRDSEYNITNLWFIYNLTQFDIFQKKAIIGLETNVYSVNLSILQNLNTPTQLGIIYDSIDYRSKNNYNIAIGPKLKMSFNSKNYFTTGLLLSTGRMKPGINYYQINSIPSTFVIRSLDFYSTLKNDMYSKGIYFTMQWDSSINDDFNIFIRYLYNEHEFVVRKIYSINSKIIDNSSFIDLQVNIIPVFNSIGLQSNNKGREKNQYLNIGISYKYNFL